MQKSFSTATIFQAVIVGVYTPPLATDWEKGAKTAIFGGSCRNPCNSMYINELQTHLQKPYKSLYINELEGILSKSIS